MTLFRLVAAVLFVLGIICLAAPTTIAGQSWATWLVSGLLAWLLDSAKSIVVVTHRNAPPQANP